MREEALNWLGPLVGEIHRLIRSAWTLQYMDRRWNKIVGENVSDYEIIVLQSSRDSLRREIISALCRLDDPAKGYVSLRSVAHGIPYNNFPSVEQGVVSETLKKYRESINNIKNKDRNAYIAHLTKNGFMNQFEAPLGLSDDLREAIFIIFQFIDYLFDNEIDWMIPKRNSQELVNLRFSLEYPEKACDA